MSNQAINKAFLSNITKQAADMVLDAIAKQYGISRAEAHDEVTDEEAELILDYMVGVERTAASALMQKHGIRWA
jgi:hypothetical protein